MRGAKLYVIVCCVKDAWNDKAMCSMPVELGVQRKLCIIDFVYWLSC